LVGEYTLENGETAVVDQLRAEQIKKSFGLPAEDADGATEEGIPLISVRERILPTVEKQVEEFQRSIDYFKNQYKKDAVHRLILSGGGVGLSGLYQFLNAHLDLEIDRCNALFQSSPEAGADKEEKKLLGPGLTAAAGLALGRCEKINVLPEEYKVTWQKTLVSLAPYSVIPLVAAGLIGFSVYQRGEIKTLNENLQKQKQEVAVLQNQIVELQKPGQELKKMQTQMKQLQKKRGYFPKAVNIPVNFEEVFDELARVADKNTSFSLISYTQSGSAKSKRSKQEKKTKDRGKQKTSGRVSRGLEILVKGNIFGDRVSVQKTLRFLLRDLKNSRAFRDVKLIRSKTIPKGGFTKPGIDFEMTLFPVQMESA
ncbi:MAG: pilus assembly protein PilM, partial [Nitrospinaceae bacterium]